MIKVRRKKVNGDWEVYGNVFQGITESFDYNDPNKPNFDDWLSQALAEDYEIEKLDND